MFDGAGFAARDHAGGEDARAVDDAPEVHVEDAMPGFVVAPEARAELDAGVDATSDFHGFYQKFQDDMIVTAPCLGEMS